MASVLLMSSGMSSGWADDSSSSWPARVEGFTPLTAGEHPRLFFRKSDLPQLRKRAETPQGKAILDRCRRLLGSEGQPKSPYTLWHGAAAGFLYQVTGDKKYAHLGQTYVQKALDGAADIDPAITFTKPPTPNHAALALSAVAMAYDLCYDGWDDDFRNKVCTAIANYNPECSQTKTKVSLNGLCEKGGMSGKNPGDTSLQVAAGGLAALAVKGDPGVKKATAINKCLKYSERHLRKVLTEHYGDHGYFVAHAGASLAAANATLWPWLQAQRVAVGKDWLSRPSVAWIPLRFALQMLPAENGPIFLHHSPGTDRADDTKALIQDRIQRGGLFCQGFGIIQPKYHAAMLWVYEHFVQPTEAKRYPEQLQPGETSYDVFTYPHRAMFAFLHWPCAVKSENPEKTLPRVSLDRRFGHVVFRNRWKDKNDIIVGVLFAGRPSEKPMRRLRVLGLGRHMEFSDFPASCIVPKNEHVAKLSAWEFFADGSGSIRGDNEVVGVDFSKASGADAVIVVTGENLSGEFKGSDNHLTKVQTIEINHRKFAFLTLALYGAHPVPLVEGDTIALGRQVISYDGKLIHFRTQSPKLKAQP